MARIAGLVGRLALVFALGLAAGAARAVEAWVQVEARPTLAQAEERARAYAARLEDVAGYRLASGWYAIALGPYDEAVAAETLARLRAAGQIPGDSYLADGSNYREQFWPVAGAAPEPGAAPVPPVPAEESPAEARAAERRLGKAEREEVQRALKAAGFYAARIDGDFGPGTRKSMAAWQRASGFAETGVLTSAQRSALVEAWRAAQASLGLAPVRDMEAGIEIALPLGLVTLTGYEAPFARYEGSDGVQVLLISATGGADALLGLYEVMQTLEVVPLAGARRIGRGRFTIEGENARYQTRVEAQLTDDGVKGFALIWPAGDAMRRGVALAAMQESFAPIPGVVLPDTAGNPEIRGGDLLAGLQLRRPERSASGFYVDAAGAVLTAAERVAGCSRITLDGEAEAEVAAFDDGLGVALLRPVAAQVPIEFGRLRAGMPRRDAEVAVAGYAYDGVLGAPTISFGTLEDVRGLDGDARLARLALMAQPGVAGGPVLDMAGGVVGMLLPRREDPAQSLPKEVRFAADAAALGAFLEAQGVAPAASERVAPLDPEDIALVGADMTVLVECWN